MLFFAFLATIAFAQQKSQKDNKQCLSTALGGALQKGFTACDLQTQLDLLDAQLGACGAGRGFTVVIADRGGYFPYSGGDKGMAFKEVMDAAQKQFGVQDYEFFLTFKAPTTLVPTSSAKRFEVFNDKDFEAAIDFSRAYKFPLVLNLEVIHDFRDPQIHQVVKKSPLLQFTGIGAAKDRMFKFTKLKADTTMKLTYADVGHVKGTNMACNWEIEVDGKKCPNGVISGSVHTGAGDIDHVTIFISGFCKDLAAGEHTMQIMVSRSSTAATCITGWQMPPKSIEFDYQSFIMEAEELLPGYQLLQTVEGWKQNSLDVGWIVGSRTMNFDKMFDDSFVRIAWVDNFRRAGGNGWCRFELRVDDVNCPSHGIAGIFYGHNPDNQHMPKQIVGYCQKPKGKHTLRVYVNRSGADCHLGWGINGEGGDNYYMEVRELGITGERLTWYQYHSTADGRDVGYITRRVLQFDKLEEDTEMRFMWNDDARAYGSARQCKWEMRVDDKPCSTGKIAFSLYTTGNDNDHQRQTLLGYCGNIGKGRHNLKIYVTGNMGHNNHDCYTGWYSGMPNNFVIEAEEASPKRL